MQDNVGKRILSEFLSYLRYKVDNDLLTMEEVESIARLVEGSLVLLGTADDFARFYGQSRTNISSVINRRLMSKPVRRVYYSFNAFSKIIPERWRNHKQVPDRQPSEEKM